MTTLMFPPSLLRHQTDAFQLVASAVTPGQNSSGAFLRMRTDGGGVWRANYGAVNLRTPDHVRTWRAIVTLCDGGTAPIIVPLCDRRQMPAPIVGGRPLYSIPPVRHSDGASFDDGSGYSQNVVTAWAAAGAALRATRLSIAIGQGSPLRGGERFSINHPTAGWRLYQVGAVDGGVVTLRPPLREAVSAGTWIEFDQPRCLMMLADPNGMALTMSLRRFANPDADFIEYPDSE